MPDTEPLSSEQIAKYEQDVSGDCPYFLQDIRPLLDHIRSLTSALEAEKKRREGAPLEIYADCPSEKEWLNLDPSYARTALAEQLTTVVESPARESVKPNLRTLTWKELADLYQGELLQAAAIDEIHAAELVNPTADGDD